MKKIVVGLILLVSIGFAETSRDKGLRLLTGANKIYILDVENKICKIDTQEGVQHPISIWRNSGMDLSVLGQGILKFGLYTFDIDDKVSGKIHTLLISGREGYQINMINSKEVCERFVNGELMGHISKYLKSQNPEFRLIGYQ